MDLSGAGGETARVATPWTHLGRRAEGARQLARRVLGVVADTAARVYVPGDRVEDALAAVESYAQREATCTVGYFNGDDETREQVLGNYLAAIDALAGTTTYLSIKLTALGPPDEGGSAMARQLATRAARAGVHLHADAMWAGSADAARAAVEAMQRDAGIDVGFTLPGRWTRSLADADWALQRGLRVRVVKGQWADPAAPDRELSQGVLDVVERLAGGASTVAIASHDAVLVACALQRLIAKKTPCELEILHGMGARRAIAVARSLGVPVRAYVPFGRGRLPYAAGLAVRDPALALRLGSDYASAILSRALFPGR